MSVVNKLQRNTKKSVFIIRYHSLIYIMYIQKGNTKRERKIYVDE